MGDVVGDAMGDVAGGPPPPGLGALGPQIAAFDDWADGRLERLRGNPVADRVFTTASQLGDMSLIWHLVSVARTLAGAPPVEALQLSALIGAESLIVNQGVKRLFRRERPTVAGDDRFDVRTPSTSSFPSGHASSAMFAATMLTRLDRRRAPLWYTIAMIVAMSRPYVRIHHASDIVGGAIVGKLLARAATTIIATKSAGKSVGKPVGKAVGR